MCGLFFISGKDISEAQRNRIFFSSERRGRDASGVCVKSNGKPYNVYKEYVPLSKLSKKVIPKTFGIVCGHSRLMTNGASDNQPLVSDNSIVFHNGIILNVDDLVAERNLLRNKEIDSEVLSSY